LKETRPLWPPQRGVGLQEPNLGKTTLRVSLTYSLGICFTTSLSDSIIFLTLTRLVVVFIFVNFSFALFTPPLGDYQYASRFARKRVSTPSSCERKHRGGSRCARHRFTVRCVVSPVRSGRDTVAGCVVARCSGCSSPGKSVPRH
jgi:hypothetical protein